MRSRIALLLIAVLGLAGLNAGCGSKYELPTERRGIRSVPTDQSYQMIATWHGLDGIQDLLLTQGSGTQLFLLFNHGGSGLSQRGEVKDYFLSRPTPGGHTLEGGLFNPVALAAGGDGTGGISNRVYVLDRGDTLLAKTAYFACDTCVGRRYITNLARYWRVREYPLPGVDPGPVDTFSTFTDTTLAFVNGIAADDEGSLYVSGVADVLTAATDPRLRNRGFAFRIYKYRRGPRYPGVLPNDRTMPGASWHRDTTWYHNDGTGIGYIRDARGMVWNNVLPKALYVADFGNSSGQKLSDTDTTGFFRYEQDGDGVALAGPQNISADAGGYIYITDNGNRRVLRYSPGGSYVQRVDIEPNDQGATLLAPVSAAASDSIVYVADRGRGEVVRYKRRK